MGNHFTRYDPVHFSRSRGFADFLNAIKGSFCPKII